MAGETGNVVKQDEKPKSYSGIPEAYFLEDVDSYMNRPENESDVRKVLKRLEEYYSKYKFMEYNLQSKKRRLKNQIPDLEKSIDMIKLLHQQKKDEKEVETEFVLSDQVYMHAIVPPTDKVCLWLGANVMLEYTLKDASELLEKNTSAAKRNLENVDHDLDFLRDQITITEVNMARVFNWDVKRRQELAKKS